MKRVMSEKLRDLLSNALRCGVNLDELSDILLHYRKTITKNGSFTVNFNEDQSYFVLLAAATATLPDMPYEGFCVRFVQTADANFVLQGNANILYKGVAIANTVTFNTVSQKVGTVVEAEVIIINGVKKWLVTNLSENTGVAA